METTRHIVAHRLNQATIHAITGVFISISDVIKPTCKDEIIAITLALT
jgi:succinate dehydrogenase hydrophobic anchor subunit